MVQRVTLKTTAGLDVTFKESASGDVTGTFFDASGAALNKASIATLVATLKNAKTSTVDESEINSRTAQTILDANGGAVTTAGVLTLKLQPLDNVIVSSDIGLGEVETHWLDITWTWVDADTVTRTGTHAASFGVLNLP